MGCLQCQQAAKALKDIANGYGNLVLSLVVDNNQVEKLACNRMLICMECPFKNELVKVGNKQYYNCSKCGCPLDAATRSTGYSCPIGKW